MKELLLFDIDGTLIKVNHAGREAFCEALFSLFPDLMRGEFCFSLRGATDLGVFKAFCRQSGIPFSQDLWGKFTFLFTEALKRVSKNYQWEIIPGARKMLNHCLNIGFSLGLATGNTRAGSMLKLSSALFSLKDPVGGFGDDCLTKIEAVRKALLSFSSVAPDHILFFGDTHSDYQAACECGISFTGIAGLDFQLKKRKYPFPVIEDYLSILDSPGSPLYREIFGES